ncbi:Mycoplasma haemagglutinin, partial [Mycoplasmoides gallisepticum]
MVKTADANNIGLQYKLNNGNVQQVEFATSTSANNTTANPTPAVDEIKVAKVTLSNLKFGSNTIEFSVPTGEGNMNKVAPMIGNMYITSSNAEANKKQIYDSIFGNTSSQTASQTSVSVDLLKGYSLATSSRTYIRQFTGLTDNGVQTSDPVYLIGLIGGHQDRTVATGPTNIQNSPNVDNDNRTFTIYVNAPVNGNYHISGAYLQGTRTARSLKFSTGTSSSNNEVTVLGLEQRDW